MAVLLCRAGYVSTHSRPKAAVKHAPAQVRAAAVSTHSRPKAAVVHIGVQGFIGGSFNTQPPEGG